MVFQWPCGTFALIRCPTGAQPLSGAMLVLVPFGGKSRVHPRFLSRLTVDEHQAGRVDAVLIQKPLRPPPGDIRTILLGGDQRLFLCDSPSACTNSHTER